MAGVPAGAGNAASGGPDPAAKVPAEMPRDQQVRQIVNLLNIRGVRGADEVKKRIADNRPLIAKHIVFDNSVLQEGLAAWAANNPEAKGQKSSATAVRSTRSNHGHGEGSGPVHAASSAQPAASQGVTRPTPRPAPSCAEAPRPTKMPRTERSLTTEVFDRPHLPRHTPSELLRPSPSLPEAAEREVADVNHPAASSSAPLLSRLRRGGTLDGLPRERGCTTPCRSQESADSLSPGMPDTTPPSLGRSATSRPAAFTAGAEHAFSRASSAPGRACWDAMHEPRSGSSMTALRRAAQLGGLSAHFPSEPDPELTPTAPTRSFSKHRIGAREAAAPDDTMKQQSKSVPQAPRADLSVRGLKDLLGSHGVDYSSCVEKSELQELLSKFEMLCQRPLEELHVSLAMAGGCSAVRPPTTAAACAALLLGKPTQTPQDTAAQSSTARAAAPRPAVTPNCPAASTSVPASTAAPAYKIWTPETHMPPPPVKNVAQVSPPETESPQDSPLGGNVFEARENEAALEVKRINSIRRTSFNTVSAWGFAVLAVQTRDIAGVQRGYRGLMKKLHPDKVQTSTSVSNAMDLIKEAKDACERSLSRQFAPGAPRRMALSVLCSQPGRRRYRLSWAAPVENEASPVRRYIVAALDPAYGKALNIAVLEPDYDEEKRRFISVGELATYVLAEEDLQKMPSLWRQNAATIQVAAANESGQSSWAILQVPLNVTTLGTNQQSPANRSAREEEQLFAEEVKHRSGKDLFSWLERQRKPQILTFLKSIGCSDDGGMKERLIAQVMLLSENQKRKGR